MGNWINSKARERLAASRGEEEIKHVEDTLDLVYALLETVPRGAAMACAAQVLRLMCKDCPDSSPARELVDVAIRVHRNVVEQGNVELDGGGN